MESSSPKMGSGQVRHHEKNQPAATSRFATMEILERFVLWCRWRTETFGAHEWFK